MTNGNIQPRWTWRLFASLLSLLTSKQQMHHNTCFNALKLGNERQLSSHHHWDSRNIHITLIHSYASGEPMPILYLTISQTVNHYSAYVYICRSNKSLSIVVVPNRKGTRRRRKGSRSTGDRQPPCKVALSTSIPPLLGRTTKANPQLHVDALQNALEPEFSQCNTNTFKQRITRKIIYFALELV